MPTDFYDVLGVSADASSDELKRAYRSRVREYHPDVNDHPEGDAQFKLVRKANDVLTDPAERKDYDRMGHREYAEKRLDDLPSFSVFPEFADENHDETGDNDERASGRGSATEPPSSAETTQSSGSQQRNRESRRDQSDRNRQPSSSASPADESASERSTESRASNPQGGSTDETGSGSETTTASAEQNSSQWADLSAETGRQNAEESAGGRRRRGLKRWYGVVLAALLSYAGGVGTYLLTHRSGALALVADLQTAPSATLLGAFPLRSPTAYVLAAVEGATTGAPGLGLLFVVGTVLLPLVVLTAVAQYGRGSAWAYALASLGPAVTVAASPFVALPVVVLLLGLAGLPLVSGFGFLVDVGRYLLATR